MLSLTKQNEWRERYRQKRPEWRPATEVFADLVRQHLKPESRVLDLGCGRGGLVEQLAADGYAPQHVTGIDPDWLSLSEHRLRIARAQGLSCRLPFAAQSFDLVFSSWLLEHLVQPAIDFAEIARVLRPGGAFVFLTPNKRHPLSGVNLLFGRLGNWQARFVERLYGRTASDTFPTYYRANSSAALRRLAQDNGLQLEQLNAISDPTYLAFNAPLFHSLSWVDEHLPAGMQIHLVGVLIRPSNS